MSTYQNNYQLTKAKFQQNYQIQPTRHKILKNHLKIVSRSSDKIITQKVQPKNYSSISKTNNIAPVNNAHGTARKGLKIQIDNRLNKVYSHIVKYRSISLRPTHISSTVDKVKQPSSQLQDHELLVMNDQQQIPTINGQLPYQLLRSYVQSIYEDYHIKDPLQALNKQFKINFQSKHFSQFNLTNDAQYDSTKTQRMTVLSTPPKNYLHSNIMTQEKDKLSTKKKILQLKRHFINELSMTGETTQKKPQLLEPSTNKKISTEIESRNNVLYNGRSNQKNQHSQESELINFNSNNKLAETKFTIASNNNNYLNSYQSVNLRSQVYQNPTVANSRVQQFNFIGENRFNSQQKKISQTFRYCFVCEQPVLESNIMYHERQCPGLRELLNDQKITKSILLSIIQNKVHKVQKQLQSSFEQISSQNLNQQFAQIKDHTTKWMAKMENIQLKDLQTSQNQTHSYQTKINSLIHNTNVLKTLQLINKLKWFVHIKNNFIKITK